MYLAYIDYTTSVWVFVSYVTASNMDNQMMMTGQTTHFSSFAVLLGQPTSLTDATVTDQYVASGKNDKKVPTGAIVGIVIGAIVFVIGGAVASYFIKKRQNEREAKELELEIHDSSIEAKHKV
jgi:tetrahydromethanopterin S-methyltransferase subunit D